MKSIQIRTALCAIALMFTFALSAENFSTTKNDPADCASFNHKQKKHSKKNHKSNSASSKKNNTAPHCYAY
ncbi:MAG: hypothetical protein NT084_02290 [Bacteroidetes bacterium]|nr:hypothetical protein [Bacteroidota bacterium]